MRGILEDTTHPSTGCICHRHDPEAPFRVSVYPPISKPLNRQQTGPAIISHGRNPLLQYSLDELTRRDVLWWCAVARQKEAHYWYVDVVSPQYPFWADIFEINHRETVLCRVLEFETPLE